MSNKIGKATSAPNEMGMLPTELPKAPTKRIISEAQVIRASTTPKDAAGMLDEAMAIIGEQVELLRIKSAHKQALDETEAKQLMGYIKGLVEINKDERERDKRGELGKMSDAELLELLKQKEIKK